MLAKWLVTFLLKKAGRGIDQETGRAPHGEIFQASDRNAE